MKPRRNRKRNEGFSTVALTGKWMLIAALGVAFSLLYVWQHVQLVRTGYTIKAMEREVVQCRKANEALRLDNERLKSPQRIEEVLAKNNLGLIFPQGKDIIRLRSPRRAEAYDKETSGGAGGTDTLLTYAGRRGGAGKHKM